MTVGKRLKEERKRLGLTQDEMAVQLGLTRYAQLNFEKDVNLPGGAYLLAALERGVDVMYVLSGHRAQLDPAIGYCCLRSKMHRRLRAMLCLLRWVCRPMPRLPRLGPAQFCRSTRARLAR